jgi:hypothetical protein
MDGFAASVLSWKIAYWGGLVEGYEDANEKWRKRVGREGRKGEGG